MMENTNLSHQGMQKFNVFSFDNDIFLERATALLQCRKHRLHDVCSHSSLSLSSYGIGIVSQSS